jgi:SAM-dependent methyltransferase
MTFPRTAAFRRPVLVILVVVGALIWFGALGCSPAAQKAKPQSLTIRNSTDRTVQYEIAPAVSGARRIKKTIEPGVIHRFPGTTDRDVFFRSAGRDMSYRLNAGHPYAFRYDENQNLDLFQASHGWSDLADLAPYVPTPQPVVDRMLALAHVDRDSVVYDLGSGDGRIVITAAKTYGARGVGIELDPMLIQTARAKAKIEGVEKLVEFRMEDATRSDFRAATVVTLYLLPESNEILRGRLEQQLRPGSLVVSHNYSIPGWESKQILLETVKTDDGQEHDIYLYRR